LRLNQSPSWGGFFGSFPFVIVSYPSRAVIFVTYWPLGTLAMNAT
jgi:hypothetical protein